MYATTQGSRVWNVSFEDNAVLSVSCSKCLMKSSCYAPGGHLYDYVDFGRSWHIMHCANLKNGQFQMHKSYEWGGKTELTTVCGFPICYSHFKYVRIVSLWIYIQNVSSKISLRFGCTFYLLSMYSVTDKQKCFFEVYFLFKVQQVKHFHMTE